MVGYDGTEGGKLIIENADGVSYEGISDDEVEIRNLNLDGLKLDKTYVKLEAGKSEALKATITPEDSVAPVSFKSSDPAVATVSENGLVTAIKPGRVTITAEGTAEGKNISDSCTVVVYSRAYLAVKQKADLKKLGLFKEECVKFTVDNKNATVNKKCVLKAKKAGTVTVKGLDAEGNELQSIEFTIEAPKFKKAEKIKQSEISEGYTIEGYSLFEEGSGIQPDSWTSKKEKIATVDASTGLITLTGEKGGTVITAYFGEGKEAAKLKYKVKVIK